MNTNRLNNATFSGHAYRVLKPTKEIFQEAAMGAKTKFGDYIFIAKKGMKGDNSMINLLEKKGQVFNQDYFISKRDYNNQLNQPLNSDVITKALLDFYPL